MKEDCGGGGDEENVCQEQGQEDKEIGARTSPTTLKVFDRDEDALQTG